MAISAIESNDMRQCLHKIILEIIASWPELHRRVFTAVHYGGSTIAAVSRSLGSDEDQIKELLQRCDQDLYRKLRGFRLNGTKTDIREAVFCVC